MSASSHRRRGGRVQFSFPPGAAAIVFLAAGAVALISSALSVEAASSEDLDAAAAITKAVAPPSAVDTDRDGRADFANPTGHAVRGEAYGDGAFGAPRARGRRHAGVDYIAEPGETVRAPISGAVARFGYAYSGDQRYRLIELAGADGARARVLYVGPEVRLGQIVRAGDPIGRAQDLGARYPRGITNHVHVELQTQGALADPATLLPPTADRTHSNT